ncbi:hypothetical protein [Nostoc sp.]
MWGGHLARQLGRARSPSHKGLLMHKFSLDTPVGCVTPEANAPILSGDR